MNFDKDCPILCFCVGSCREFSQLNHTNPGLVTWVFSAQKALRFEEMLPLHFLPVVAPMLSWRQFHWASSENNFLLLLSLFGNFLAPNQHNCAEVGGVPRLRLRLRASAGVVQFQTLLSALNSASVSCVDAPAAVFVASVDRLAPTDLLKGLTRKHLLSQKG